MIQSRVNGFGIINSLACIYIYIYCNIERNIMKNHSGSPSFGIHERIFVYLFYFLAIVYLFF